MDSIWPRLAELIPAVVLLGLIVGVSAIIVWLVVDALRPTRNVDDGLTRDPSWPRLERSRRRAIAGVCAGAAHFFGWEVGTTRSAFALLALLSGGWTVVLAYLLLWRLMPLAAETQPAAFDLSEYQVD